MSVRNKPEMKKLRRYARQRRKDVWRRFYIGRNLMVMFDMAWWGRAGFQPNRDARRHWRHPHPRPPIKHWYA